MHFWSKADSSALPDARQGRGNSETDGLYLVDAEHVSQVEGTYPQRQLELVEFTERTWGDRLKSAGRRAFDITFALLALTASLPLMIVIVLAIRMSSSGPAFYRQKRIGHRDTDFDLLKFRTMVQNADGVLTELLDRRPDLRKEFDEKLKLTDDPRITRIGRFLRTTSLDELPQFINVLKGDMGVVGPRPKLLEEAEFYGEHLPLVLSVRPGITGLWQVSGRNDTTYEERIQLDCYYVENRNAWLDLKIILKTVTVMVKPSNGAY